MGVALPEKSLIMKEKVIILGGGVTGLTSAWALARSKPNSQVVLLESQSTPGGWIQSVRCPDGAVHEIGPRSMRFRYRAGKQALAMVGHRVCSCTV